MGQAARLFNGTAEHTLLGKITPTQEQRDYLQTHWNALAEFLKSELLNRHGYSISTWIQGSYKYGTLIKPVQKGHEYDVDLGVYFDWARDNDPKPIPKQLRDWVQSALIDFKNQTPAIRLIETPPKERCSRAVYDGSFHIDTPVYHLDPDTDMRRLACWSNEWEGSDPKKLYKWFRDELNSIHDSDQLRRLIRYLKGWAVVAFEGSELARPSSIFLTVLVTEIRASEIWFSKKNDDDALHIMAHKIYGRVVADRVLLNPVDQSEDLNRIPKDNWGDFVNRLSALCDAAEKAKNANDEATAALAWSEAFFYLMPLPESESLEIVEEASGTALMQIPNIKIDVFKANPRTLTATYANEVPSAAKNCELVFTITNPEVVPQYAFIEWTVRNDEGEAESIGDVGHMSGGINQLQMTEHTAYAGKHYMDCVVKHNGQVYALRRVPVTIKDLTHPPRNPPAPSYTKLRSIKKRR